MLFKKELAEKILSGDKTQTRRPIKSGDVLRFDDDSNQQMVIGSTGRLKISTKRDYAVCYGRGKPCRWWGYSGDGNEKIMVTWEEYQNWSHHADFAEKFQPMRILVTGIRREDVRNISEVDAIAEGFNGQMGFWKVWTDFYDPEGWGDFVDYDGDDRLRPDELYQAWVYEFELVQR